MNFRFDLKTVQLFVSVIELKSLTKAADREHIATSAMSKRVSDLEEALGVTLLQRQARGVEPTAAGTALYDHARSIIKNIEQLVGEMADYADGSKGHVRLLANRSSLMQGLPEDISSFLATHADVEVDFEEEPSPDILRDVLEGRADLGVFTLGHAELEGLETFEYRRDRLVVIVPRAHALSARETLRFSDVLEFDVVNLQTVTAWNNLLKENADRIGATLRTRFRVSGFDVLCALVAAGLGVAVAPRGVLRASPDARLLEIPLDEEWAERRHLICVRSVELLPAPARAMLNHLLSAK